MWIIILMRIIQAYYGITEYLDYKGDKNIYNSLQNGNKLIYSKYIIVQVFYYFDLNNPDAGLQVLFEMIIHLKVV